MDVKAMLLMHSDNPDELRSKWSQELVVGPELGGTISHSEATKMSTYLENRVDIQLESIADARAEALRKERESAAKRISIANSNLRTSLNEGFIRDAGITVADGKATFTFRGSLMTVTHDAQNSCFLLNGQKLVECPGTVSDRLVATLTALEDRKRQVSQ